MTRAKSLTSVLFGTTKAVQYLGMVDATPLQSRKDAALSAARALVNAMEIEDVPIERCLMLAQRLARLIRDEDAQTWLDLEQRGYPADFKGSLGACAKYAYRFQGDKIVVLSGLPAMEAARHGAVTVLNKLQFPTINGTAENYLVSGATREVMAAAEKALASARNQFVTDSATYARMRGALHRWAVDTLISLELGNAAETIFEAARVRVDQFVRSYVPKAAEQLVAVHERMQERSTEALSQALVSCRRLIASVADAVFPPSEEPYIDGSGRKRTVGEDQHNNRLLAFIERQVKSGSTREIITSQLGHLAARLDAVYEKACKGVHADVTEDEARLVVIETYLFLGEVTRYAISALAADTVPTAVSSDVPQQKSEN